MALSTIHAIFPLHTVLHHYVKSVSTVTICALDISKAFDRVDHFALLKVLIDKGLPKKFIDILLEWLRKCNVCQMGQCLFLFLFNLGQSKTGWLTVHPCLQYTWMC